MKTLKNFFKKIKSILVRLLWMIALAIEIVVGIILFIVCVILFGIQRAFDVVDKLPDIDVILSKLETINYEIQPEKHERSLDEYMDEYHDLVKKHGESMNEYMKVLPKSMLLIRIAVCKVKIAEANIFTRWYYKRRLKRLERLLPDEPQIKKVEEKEVPKHPEPNNSLKPEWVPEEDFQKVKTMLKQNQKTEATIILRKLAEDGRVQEPMKAAKELVLKLESQ